MDFVLLLQATQNSDGVFHGRFADVHLLETTLQRSIFLNVFAVLIKRCGTNGMQLATRQRRLKHVARIQGAIATCTCANNGMQLIDEQDDTAFGLLYFAQNALQTIFEFATILRACHHCAQIKRNDVLVAQRGRNVARHNTLRQAFNNCRLACARFANKHRVVLGTARKHLNGAADLFRATDHGVKLAFARLLRKVLTVLLQRLELGFLRLIGNTRVAAKLLVGGLDVLARHARSGKQTARRRFIFGKRNEQMLGSRVAVAQFFSSLHRVIQHRHKRLTRHTLHSHVATGLFGHTDNLIVNVHQKRGRIGANALDDGRNVVLAARQKRLEHMNWLCLGAFRVRSNAHGLLQRLLRRQGQFLQITHVHKTILLTGKTKWFNKTSVARGCAAVFRKVNRPCKPAAPAQIVLRQITNDSRVGHQRAHGLTRFQLVHAIGQAANTAM